LKLNKKQNSPRTQRGANFITIVSRSEELKPRYALTASLNAGKTKEFRKAELWHQEGVVFLESTWGEPAALVLLCIAVHSPALPR